MFIDNLNQLPYTPPSYFEEICRNKANYTKLSDPNFYNCSVDPYYDERLKLYKGYYDKYQKMNNNNLSFDERKQIMRKILHDGYNEYEKQYGHLPYAYFDTFRQKVYKEVQKDLELNIKDCRQTEHLQNFIDNFKQTNYLIDPYYSFITLIDWITQELISDKSLSDSYVLCFIQYLIDRGYIGFNQYRFYLHTAILKRKRDNFMIELLNKYKYFEKSLQQEFTFKNGLYRCLIKDLGKFAIINNSYKIIKLFVEKCNLNIKQDIPPKLIKNLCSDLKYQSANTNIINYLYQLNIGC